MRVTQATLTVMAFAALGGLLFGFDIGVVSGALVFMKGDLALSPGEASLIVAAVLYGSALATLLSGPFTDRFGRRLSINVSAAIFIVGVVVLLIARNFATAMAGRLVQGLGDGIIGIVVPLYMAETLPARVRGRGIALFQLSLTFGILLGYLVNFALSSTGDWRAMFAVVLIPAVAFLIGGLFTLPESPRWLYAHGRSEHARAVLTMMLGASDADAAMEQIHDVVSDEGRQAGRSWALLLRPGYRKAFMIAFAVCVLTQLCGTNVLLQFNATILAASGLTTAILGTVVVGAINFVVTIIGLVLVDRVGRRRLLIIGTVGVTAALTFIAVIHAVFPASAVIGYATLAGFIAFIVFFAVGPGVVVWLAISETLPLAIRAKGMAVSLFANQLISALLASVFMAIVGVLGYSGMFLILALFAFAYLLVAVFLLPETKGRSLEEIENEVLSATR